MTSEAVISRKSIHIPQPAKSSQLARLSERKLKANRENAKKSTGPKTPRGKAFSRRNAVKHGLFVNYTTDFYALDEDPGQYQKLLNGLWDQYQPVGRAEEVEVERIALCCWRLKRAWRYENAVNLAARRDFVRAEMKDQGEYCKKREKEEEAVIAELEIVNNEMDETGQMSDELKQRIFAMMPGMQCLWPLFDKGAEELMKKRHFAKIVRKASPEERTWARDFFAVMLAIALLKELGRQRILNVREIAVGQHAIPNPESLERLLRYETTIERQLNRAMDRLHRLQRRRRGEFDPPSVRVHLS